MAVEFFFSVVAGFHDRVGLGGGRRLSSAWRRRRRCRRGFSGCARWRRWRSPAGGRRAGWRRTSPGAPRRCRSRADRRATRTVCFASLSAELHRDRVRARRDLGPGCADAGVVRRHRRCGGRLKASRREVPRRAVHAELRRALELADDFARGVGDFDVDLGGLVVRRFFGGLGRFRRSLVTPSGMSSADRAARRPRRRASSARRRAPSPCARAPSRRSDAAGRGGSASR